MDVLKDPLLIPATALFKLKTEDRFNDKAHDCSNDDDHCSIDDTAGSSSFVQSETEQPLHGLNQAQALPFLVPGKKERAKRVRVITSARLLIEWEALVVREKADKVY